MSCVLLATALTVTLYLVNSSCIDIMVFSKLVLPVVLQSIKGQLISLPFMNGAVTLGVDGNQSISFRIDTGSARFLAVYGPAYEKTRGVGSCTKIAACYFCPQTNPCDDIFQREKWSVRFAGGTRYAYVEHSVTINSGGSLIPNIKMALIVKAIPEFEHTSLSTGLLGLSYGLADAPETLLDQLRQRNLIMSEYYSIHTSGNTQFFSGTLTLGALLKPMRSSTVRMSQSPEYSLRKIAVPQSRPMRLVIHRPQENVYSMTDDESRQEAPSPIMLDTGSRYICMSGFDFNRFWLATKRHLFHIPESRKLYRVKKQDVDNLPTLSYQIGELPTQMDIQIKPKHYVSDCDDNNDICSVFIVRIPHKYYIMGQPLFRAYNIGFNLLGNTTSLSLESNDAGSDIKPGKFDLPQS